MDDARSERGQGGGAGEPPPRVRLRPPGWSEVDGAGREAVAEGATVVTPNRRAARARGVRFTSLEGLARGLLRPLGLQPAPELARWRAMRDAAEAVWNTDDRDGTARTVAASVRELLRAGLDEMPEVDEGSRLGHAAALARHYRGALLRAGLVDPAEMLWWVGRGGPSGRAPAARRRLHVLGYPRIGDAEVAFLAAACAPGSVLELPDGDAPELAGSREVAARLEARGWRTERAEAQGPAAPPRAALRAWRLPSVEAEVRAALTEVKRLLVAGTAPEAMVLVARDEAAYGPLLRAVAWEYGVPVAASYAVPLRDTRVGGWTATLLEAVREGLPFEATARLLAHPLAGGLAPERWDAARSEHPRGRAAWEALDPRVEALTWPPRAPRAGYLAQLRRAFDAFALAERVEARADDALAFHRLSAAAEGLGRPADDVVGLRVFLHELDGLLNLLSVPADARRQGVELHTPLALYGARYRHLFVLGACEGALPLRIADDPVLDFAERRAARARGVPLEGAAEAARREALSFQAVLWTLDARRPGASLTLSYAEEAGIASPVLAQLGLEAEAPPAKPPASPEEERSRALVGAGEHDDDAVLAGAHRAWRVERRREDGSRPDAFDGVVGEPYPLERHTFSATQLLDLGQCAFRWLCRRPLGLAEPEEAEEDVGPLLRGRLYHRALELALARALTAAGAGASAEALRRASLEALEAAFEEAERDLNAVAVPGWELRRGHHLESLRRVVRAESFLPEGSEVMAVERWFPERGQPPVVWRGLRVRGKVDRVDRRPEGLVLLDYKTRSSRPAGAQDERGKARVDLQLPLYLEAAAPALFAGEAAAGAQYYSLTKAEVLQEVRVDRGLDAELDGVVRRARRHLASGSYPVAPDVDYRACATCDFELVCRKGPRTERMRSAGAFEPDAAAGEEG